MSKFNELIKQCENGHRPSQKEVYEKFYPTVYKACMRYCSSTEEGHDHIQDAFIKVFTKIPNFRGNEANEFGGWVKKIAINHCIDYKRKNKEILVSITDSVELVDDRDDYEELDLELEYSSQDVLNAIQKLSPRYNSVFNLYVMDGYSHDEIGDILEITPRTSKSNLHKAKAKLRVLLREEKYGKS